MVNHTSRIGTTHLVDSLLTLGISVQKVYAPEHGFRGNAANGQLIKDGVDTKTQLPITSLYGSNKKPTAEQLEGVDVLIFDLQDVGTRFYTYISTMHYVMEAAAENGKKVIILDRPNPNGMYIDGPVLDLAFQSFVGMHPIPILHGLTVGELAKMINGEGWLKNGISCDITVIPMANYTHNMSYPLPIHTSPNLPNDLSVQLYPSFCLFEGTVISVGRGTYEPFQQIGHPDFTDMSHSFKPVSIEGMSKYPKHENKTCYGIKFTKENAVKGMSLKYLIEFYNKYQGEDAFFIPFFDKLAGTDELKQQIQQGLSEEEIKATWQDKLNAYKLMRQNYLIYKD